MIIDEEKCFETIWEVLGMAREDCIPEGAPHYDEQWAEVCDAMAHLREALGLPSEVEKEQQGEA